MMELSKSEKVALALGSNLGDRLDALRKAMAALAPYMKVTATSAVYETAPAYVIEQPSFLNAAVMGETRLEPHALLGALKQLEKQLGRKTRFRNGPREIDIDILFQDARVLATPELTLPHPLLAERDFVLRPLADIAPEWKHPKNGLTVREMLARLPQTTATNVGKLS
jgi:2-amino-4-hydroxy-6-hydroxymethyldihydropteridine diphosphokinase